MTEDEEFEFRARAERERAKPVTPSRPAGPSAADKKLYSPTGSFGENMLAGAGRAVDQVIDFSRQGTAKVQDMFDGGDRGQKLQEVIDEKKRLDQPLKDTWGGMLGGAGAETAVAAIPGAKVLQGANAFKSPLSRSVARLGGAGAVGGVVEGTKGVASDESLAGNTGLGAAAGVVGQTAGSALSKTIAGIVPPVKRALEPATGRIKKLYDDATLGQISDKDGSMMGRIANSAEESLKSFPLAGALFRGQRKKGQDSWRDGVIEKVKAPGVQLDRNTPVRERIDQIQQGFSSEYDDALGGKAITLDPQFRTTVARQAGDPSTGLPPDIRRTTAENIDEQYVDLFRPGAVGPNGPMPPVADARNLKAMESRLGKQMRQRMMGGTPDAAGQAEMAGAARSALRTSYRSQLPAKSQEVLQELDGQYMPFKTVERASTAAPNLDGEFTPQQLKAAVKARTKPDEFAAGRGALQEEAEVGKRVYQDRMADTGTADRNLWATMGHLAAAPFVGGANILVPAAGLTKSGRNAMTGTTRAQLLLKKLRADKALEAAGIPAGVSLDELVE